MLRLFFFFLSILVSSDTYATSTIFDQSSIVKNNSKSLSLNANKSMLNLQSIAVTGSLSFVGEKLYKFGFLSPFGLTPSSIVDLSPLAYEANINNTIHPTINKKCIDRFVSKKTSYFSNNFIKNRVCDFLQNKDNSKNIINLLDRYF